MKVFENKKKCANLSPIFRSCFGLRIFQSNHACINYNQFTKEMHVWGDILIWIP